MINEIDLRVLSNLDSPKTRQELSDELDYIESTVSRALSNLEQVDLIYKEQTGNQVIAKPADIRCVEALQFLTKSNPHVDFPDLLTTSMLNVLYYLNSERLWTAAELTERTGHARATVYRNLRTLTNRAMATKERSQYALREEFNELHLFAYELRHHAHRARIKRDVGGGTIVWESHDEFLVRTEKDIENPDYHRTGLDAFDQYDLQFFTTSAQYYLYTDERESLAPEDLVCHLLLIENDSRHRKYVLLLIAKTELSEENLRETASYYSIEDVVIPLVEFLHTEGQVMSENTPKWEEFEELAAEYEVDL
jgi:predicted transcriptional regulator